MKFLDSDGLNILWARIKDVFQVKLVSGTNIKTVNGSSLLGSGNISIETSGTVSGDYLPIGGGTMSGTLTIGTGFLDVQGDQKIVMNESSDITPKICINDELDIAFSDDTVMQLTANGISIPSGSASNVYTTNGYTMTIEAIDDATINALS